MLETAEARRRLWDVKTHPYRSPHQHYSESWRWMEWITTLPGWCPRGGRKYRQWAAAAPESSMRVDHA